MKKRLIVEQKITAFVNRYAVYEVYEDGNKGKLLALAQQKRLAFKEKVIFYSDEEKSNEVFSFRAEKVMDIHGKYIVEGPDGTRIGAFRKEFKQSLLKSTWAILDEHNEPSLYVQESSTALALLRRFIGFVPIIGEFLDIILNFFKYHFEFTDTNQRNVGRYEKTTLFRDHYDLYLTDSAQKKFPWQLMASVAVALDALQSR